MPRYASVFPLVTARALARPFTYLGDGLEKGSVVSVPFGRAQRRGVVVDTEDEKPDGVEPVAVEKVLGTVPAPLVDLALWLADYYGSTPARTLALVAPPSRARRAGAKRRAQPPRTVSAEIRPDDALAGRRSAALARIVGALGSPAHLLLHGATGSGKTEVYLRACEAALERGLGAIVLVPEIALTPQAAARFRARFGDRVAVLHSRLTEAERRDERERIASGEARVVVGARSAVFAPVERLGLICVDEEHDASYKQDSDPRYDARTVAAKRGALENAVVVYGSATPRAESWELLERLDLGGRLGASLPPVKIVDLRREAGYPLSAPLLAALGEIEDEGGKAILLLNRRGVAPAIHCRACGVTPRCEHCDVALTLHGDGRLHCHHCGATQPAPKLCPSCGAAELARLGAGTERLEEELAEKVPGLELLRLDADTTADPTRLAEVLARFEEADRVVLLGTQMVAKGHHFSGVRLAAVVDADTGLGLPDFRAEERTFQLVTQLAGRSGRDAPGRVLVQTYQPDARPIMLAARHAVDEFLSGELDRRRALGYPPFKHLVSIVVSGPERDGPDDGPARAAHRAGAPRRRGSPRPGAAPAPARPASRPAPGEDGQSAERRRPGRAAARARPRRRCAATASPPSWTSTPRASDSPYTPTRERGRRPGQGRAARRRARGAAAACARAGAPVPGSRAADEGERGRGLRRGARRARRADGAAHAGGARRRPGRAAGRHPPARARLPVRGGRAGHGARQPAARVELGGARERRRGLPVARHGDGHRPRRAAGRDQRRGGTPAGEEVRVEAEGLEARVIQHELDHLDGVLTLDRTTDEGRKQAFAALRPR